MEVKKETVEFALRVLDKQYSYCTQYYGENKKFYFDGMRKMFEILVTDGYLNNLFVECSEDGKHKIVGETV